MKGFQTPRITLHAMNLCLQNRFGELHTKSRVFRKSLNTVRALTVYHVFEDEKSTVSDKNWSSKKSNIKRPQD